MNKWMREWKSRGLVKNKVEKEGRRVPCKSCCGVKTDPTRSEEPLMDSSIFSSDPLYSKAIGSERLLVYVHQVIPLHSIQWFTGVSSDILVFITWKTVSKSILSPIICLWMAHNNYCRNMTTVRPELPTRLGATHLHS